MSLRTNTAKLLLASVGLALPVTYALGRQGAQPAPARSEYRIVQDVGEAELAGLVEEGWEYAGYLGQGVKGQGNYETLWRRAR